VIEKHLGGEIHAGLYPLQHGDCCRVLVCDFDDAGWVLDSLAHLDAARTSGVPAALERSRSGDGGLLPHVNTSGKADSLPHLKAPDALLN
jgi:hypothetical protein